jgi:GT2 family glycosyltransferase
MRSSERPLVDITIVDYGTPELVRACYESIVANFKVPAQAHMVDAKAMECSYAVACNVSAKATADKPHAAPYLLMLNADTECLWSQWPIISMFEANDALGIVGPLQIDGEGIIRHAGIFGSNTDPQHRYFGRPLEPHKHEVNEWLRSAVTVSGSVFYCRRDVWEEMGGFLETPHFYEETALCYKARHHGHRVAYTGAAPWLHHFDGSGLSTKRKVALAGESQILFRQAMAAEGIACN